MGILTYPESSGLTGLDGLSYLCGVVKVVVTEVRQPLQVQMKALEAPTDVCLPWLIPVPGGRAVGVS